MRRKAFKKRQDVHSGRFDSGRFDSGRLSISNGSQGLAEQNKRSYKKKQLYLKINVVDKLKNTNRWTEGGVGRDSRPS